MGKVLFPFLGVAARSFGQQLYPRFSFGRTIVRPTAHPADLDAAWRFRQAQYLMKIVAKAAETNLPRTNANMAAPIWVYKSVSRRHPGGPGRSKPTFPRTRGSCCFSFKSTIVCPNAARAALGAQGFRRLCKANYKGNTTVLMMLQS